MKVAVFGNQGFSVHVNYTQHELISVEKFVLDPIQESIYSLATFNWLFRITDNFTTNGIFFSIVQRTK